MEIERNTPAGRWQVELEGELAWIDFVESPTLLRLTHTEVPVTFRGKGIGEKLVLAALHYAKDHNLGVSPECAYVEAVLRKHPEFQSVTAHRTVGN